MYKNLFLESIKNLKFFKQAHENSKKIVFYSEGKKYDHFYTPFIKSCIKNNLSFTYLSSDNEKPFQNNNEKYKFYFIGKSFVRTYLFTFLDCKNLITTTPDIGNSFLKKSINCKNMIFFHHSMCGLTTTLKNGALSHYDTILCSNKKHFEELLNYNFINKNKKLIKFGYPKIDEILNNSNIKSNNKKIKNILIAPSWGNEKEDYELYKRIILNLIDKEIYVKFRPHPMTILYFKKYLKKLKNYFKKYNNFEISEVDNNVKDYMNSDFIISDWSGSAMEFSLATEKPCLFLNTKRKLINKSSSEEQKKNSFEYFFRKYLDCEISISEIENIYFIINRIHSNNSFYEKLKYFKSEYLYNLGKTDTEIDKFMLSIF
jgi:YidC/Oxa1 family membrane protein insertase